MPRIVIDARGSFFLSALSADGTAVPVYDDSNHGAVLTLPASLDGGRTLWVTDGYSAVDATFTSGSWSRTDRLSFVNSTDIAVQLNSADVDQPGAATALPSTPFGRGLLTPTDAAAARVLLGAASAASIGLSPALAPLRAALDAGADCSMVLVGDSTGNNTDEWFYLFAQWLADRYPNYTVEHRLWNDTNKCYDRPTNIQTGPNGASYLGLGGSLNDASQDVITDLSGGDLDLRVKLAAADWTPSAISTILAKFQNAGARTFRFQLNTTGALWFDWTTDGSTIQTTASSVTAVGFTDGATGWVRVTLDVDNGSTQHEIKFYKSTDGVTWTQVGSTVTRSGTTSVFQSGTNAAWEIGGRGGSGELLAGRFYEVQIRSGIGDSFPLIAAPLATAWYDSGSTTPSTRGGSPVLTLYNGSISGGAITANFSPQVTKMVPPGRHVLAVISTGHNEGMAWGPPWMKRFNDFATLVAARASCPLVAVAQNPRISPATAQSIYAHKQRIGDLTGWAQQGVGRGLMNAYQAFVDDGRPLSDLVDASDGIHPTSAGSLLWASVVESAFTAA